MGVPAGDRGQHRGVGDPQPGDTADPQLEIEDGVGVGAHPAAADGMVDSVCGAADVLGERGVAGGIRPGADLDRAVAGMHWGEQ